MKYNINKYINYSIFGFALSLSISKAGTVIFSLLMIILWLFEGQYKDKIKILKKSNFIVFLFFIILLSAISIIWSPDKEYALNFIRKYWHFLVIPIIFTSLKKEYIKHVVTFFLIGILISMIFSYGIFFELINYKDVLPSNPAPFMDHMNYSTYLAFASLLLLNRFFFEEELKYKLFYCIYFLVTTSSLFINGGRTGQAIFVLTIFIVGFINIKRKFLALLCMLIITTSILFIAYNVSPNFQNRLSSAVVDTKDIIDGDFGGSLGQRVSLWIIGSNIFVDNILTGTGTGNELNGFKYYAEKYDFPDYNLEGYDKVGFVDYHNSFIQYAVQLGLIGLFLYLGIFYSLLRHKFQDRLYRNLNIIFITVFILHSMVFFSFHLIHPMVLFSLFASLLAVISREGYKEV